MSTRTPADLATVRMTGRKAAAADAGISSVNV
jgi:hypothetical protein